MTFVGACAYDELVLVKDIDLVHYRIGSIPALKLERFTKLEVKRNKQTGVIHLLLSAPTNAHSLIENMPPSEPHLSH